MKCDIKGCVKKAKWIVDDHGVDTSLCAEHLDEFYAVQKQMKNELNKVNMKQHGST